MPTARKYNYSNATKRKYKKASVSRKPAKRNYRKKQNANSIKGVGAYRLANKNKAVARGFRNVAADLGGYIAGKLGADKKTGRMAGRFLGKHASKLIGFGDYNVTNEKLIKTNSLFTHSASPPTVINTPTGCIVRHREYIKDINSATGFSLQSFPINPGLATSFPWLYNIASNFENYKFRGLAFEFKSTSANSLGSTNTALGTIIMAAQYNAASPLFVNKQQMENYTGAISCKPSESALCGIECKPSELVLDKLFVRSSAVPDDQDQRLYDLGNFQLAAQGSQAVAQVGELWATYELELYHPKMYGGLFGGNIISGHWYLQPTISTSAYFGASQIASANNTLHCTFTTNAIIFPSTITSGQFMIVYSVQGSSTASLVRPTFSDGTNCTDVNIFTNNTLDAKGPAADTHVAVTAIHAMEIDGEPQGGATVTLSGATLPTSITSGDVWIIQMNPLII